MKGRSIYSSTNDVEIFISHFHIITNPRPCSGFILITTEYQGLLLGKARASVIFHSEFQVKELPEEARTSRTKRKLSSRLKPLNVWHR